MPFGLAAPRFLPFPLIASFAVLTAATVCLWCQLIVMKVAQRVPLCVALVKLAMVELTDPLAPAFRTDTPSVNSNGRYACCKDEFHHLTSAFPPAAEAP